MNPSVKIDVFQFCQSEQARDGRFAIADMSRLTDLLVRTDGEVEWSLAGRTRARTGAGPDSLLNLRIAARLHLPCSRCLQAREVSIESTRDYLVVRSEAEAERRDDPESDIDVLVGERRFDVLEWIEDEMILALPPVQFHERCDGLAALEARAQQPEEASSDGESDRRRPFEALKGLKRPGVE